MFAVILGTSFARHYFIVYFVVGRPTTPMSLDRADRLFQQGLRAGWSRADVEAWLASQGVLPGPPPLGCEVVDRHVNPIVEMGRWMERRGNQSIAERAGLNADAVFSHLRIAYPDAGGGLIERTEIRIYLFFDKNGRLPRHWVEAFNMTT